MRRGRALDDDSAHPDARGDGHRRFMSTVVKKGIDKVRLMCVRDDDEDGRRRARTRRRANEDDDED